MSKKILVKKKNEILLSLENNKCVEKVVQNQRNKSVVKREREGERGERGGERGREGERWRERVMPKCILI